VCACVCVYVCECVHAAVLTEGRTGLHGVQGASPQQSHSVRGEQNPQHLAAFMNQTVLKELHIYAVVNIFKLLSTAEYPVEPPKYTVYYCVYATTCYTPC